MSDTKPTTTAIRAATALQMRLFIGEPRTHALVKDETISEIIDRETGLPELIAELQRHWIDGECYCLPRAEGGHGEPCAHCTTGELLKRLGWSGDLTELRGKS